MLQSNQRHNIMNCIYKYFRLRVFCFVSNTDLHRKVFYENDTIITFWFITNCDFRTTNLIFFLITFLDVYVQKYYFSSCLLPIEIPNF